ncbi:ferrous iron transport protein B [Ammonifex thiophilus]|uniref:Ferrous iron transport protein B n=1 Tax=Ammonifex thiophilus TaxID=444093 RepID=A0A3D8P218_9THEO|nr:ferrous iron transport protein B [Ammonifex thiophilus]RDV80708.1 ferrous iron transport protein B [Ammonifex thiophilus]
MSKSAGVVALAGNPNVGKTCIFNALTGMRQKVGNWPGVTVEKKEGVFVVDGREVMVVDLPGIYGLTPYSVDEKIARDFLLKEKPGAVVAVVDTTNLERNLYLVVELLELGANLVLDLNMIDRVEGQGVKINKEKLSRGLGGVPIVETAAHKGFGVEALKKVVLEAIQKGKREEFKVDYGSEAETAISELAHLLEGKVASLGFSPRWTAIKLLEGDPEVQELVKQQGGEEILKMARQLAVSLEKKLGSDPETFFAERRYGFIRGLVRQAVTATEKDLAARLTLSDRLDRILTSRVLGIPIFLLLMWLTFQLVFKLGAPIADGIDTFFGWLGESASSWLGSVGAPEWLASLVKDGVISGVGSVLVFLPNIMLLFLALSFLEDTGYMARAAFVMDRLMHTFGLHGKSFIPMLLGFGCNVPAIMATRTLESEKDRILTILVNPLMSCTARLPIYVLFAGAFFAEKYRGTVIFSLYLLGIILALLVAILFKNTLFKGAVAPFIMELPPYRLPSVKSLLLHMWERSRVFLIKAGTIIFTGVLLVWLLASLPLGVEYGSAESLVGKLGQVFAPLLKPAGFGEYQAAVALIFGILAKEIVVGTLGTLYGVGEEGLASVLPEHFDPASAYAFMVMSLIYIPCLATIATIKREAGWKWAAFAVAYSLVLGWVVAVIFYQILRHFWA